MTTTNLQPRWGYLLDQLCTVTGITRAAAVSADGLVLAHSSALPRDAADQVAAFTAGLESLTRGMAKLMEAGGVEQTVVDMRDGRVIVMAIGDGSILTVLAAKDADMALVAYEMVTMINSVGAVLTPEHRGVQRA